MSNYESSSMVWSKDVRVEDREPKVLKIMKLRLKYHGRGFVVRTYTSI